MQRIIDTIYPAIKTTLVRSSLIEFGKSVNPTHLVTFNFHARYAPDVANQRLRRWHIAVMRRLFGARCFKLPKQDVIEFVGFPEFTISGDIHYHTAMRVPASHNEYFMRIAERRWKTIVPTGTFNVRQIQQTQDDLDRVMNYITKRDPAADEVIHSSMFDYS